MRAIILALVVMASARADGLQDAGQRTRVGTSAVTGSVFSGCGAPATITAVAFGDSYIDACASPRVEYVCAGASCTAVAAGQWQLRGTGAPHTIVIPVAGSPITTGTGSVGTPNAGVNFACTITSVKTVGNATGSITVDVWKANGAVPSSANKISATAPATLSSAQMNQSGSLSGWSLAVAVNDVLWASVATVDGVLTNVTVQIGCQ